MMKSRIAVFLDLQGTLGGEGLGDILDFSFFPFAIPAIKLLNDAGLLAIVATNQSHIAYGRFTYADFENRVAVLQNELAEQGARWDAVYCCSHSRVDVCTCKKPLPGLLVQAAQDFHLDLPACYMVGDSGAWDMLLAQAVGCKGVLVRTGLGESSLQTYRHLWAGMEADTIAKDVLDAARWIVSREKQSLEAD
jgi:D-glycero-D-manno-heptose 1,7-bisphosphate phosphatase